MTFTKPHLSFWQIINMNVGFFGIQYSFGLQQSAVNPIYDFLGAKPDEIPWLNLAGPLTGLLIQPVIGALSDKTWIPKLGAVNTFAGTSPLIVAIPVDTPISHMLRGLAGKLYELFQNSFCCGILLAGITEES